MDESAAATRHRVSARGEPRPSCTARRPAASPHGRPAAQSGTQSSAAWKKDAGRNGHPCHAGNFAALAPEGLWMNQIARNLIDAKDGLLNGKRYLIHDRDPL